MSENKKLNVGIISSSLLGRTGFSNNIRALLPYLYKKNKYNLFHLNQGVADTPEFQRYPWNNEGVFKQGTFDINRFQSQDEGYKRHVSYGNLAVESWILRNKIDVVMAIEDGWAFELTTYTGSKWYPHLKENFLLWTTIDSSKILPMYKEWAQKTPNFWVWASFAEREMKEESVEKFGHIQTVHGCLDTKDYYPILKREKLELRKKFNIDSDTFIFLQLGRNQIRKMFCQSIESFAKFKKLNPKAKAKLFFFCAWYEGWPLERVIQEVGLKKEDVLTAYFCKNCREWEIKPYDGEFKDCRFCGAKGEPPSQQSPEGRGQKTCGVDSTIPNSEMSKIYGIADAALSIFTSGGQEFFSIESLLCGLPLLCTDYSCGEDFTCNDFVFSLDGVFTYEVGTGFKKHVPNINTIVKFMEKIYSMSSEQKREIISKGRDWALNTFDVSIIGPKVEEWLDSRKPVKWDYQYKIEPKNPNAPIQHIEDNKEFIKQCYRQILNMEVKDDDTGLNYWMQFLSQPDKTRDHMVSYMRNVAAQENAKNQKVDFSDSLIKNDKKHFLLVCKESAGDIFNATALLESLRNSYPAKEWNIYFACDPQYFDLIDGCKYIDKVVPYQQFMESEIACIGAGENKGMFHGYCFLTTDTQRHLSYLSNNNISLNLK